MIEKHHNELKKHFHDYISEKKIEKSLLSDEYLKLYLNINESMNIELKMSKEFYTLATDIFRVLSLSAEDRSEDGINYLSIIIRKLFNRWSIC